MSVIMLQWAKGDPQRLEEYAAQNREGIQEIIAQAKEHGVIAHRFYGSEGQILIARRVARRGELRALCRGGGVANRTDVPSGWRDRRALHDLAEA